MATNDPPPGGGGGGSPKTAEVMQPFHPLLGPREGKEEVANFDSVPLLGTPDKTGVT